MRELPTACLAATTRCNVLDDQRMVCDAFAVGMDGNTNCGAVLEHWAMVRRYMEEGPAEPAFSTAGHRFDRNNVEQYGDHPGERAVFGLSMYPDAAHHFAMGSVSLPCYAMKTCKRLVWPKDVEDACAIDPQDPFILEEPSYAGNAKTRGLEGDERLLAYRERAVKMALEYDAELRERLGPDGTAAGSDRHKSSSAE